METEENWVWWISVSPTPAQPRSIAEHSSAVVNSTHPAGRWWGLEGGCLQLLPYNTGASCWRAPDLTVLACKATYRTISVSGILLRAELTDVKHWNSAWDPWTLSNHSQYCDVSPAKTQLCPTKTIFTSSTINRKAHTSFRAYSITLW